MTYYNIAQGSYYGGGGASFIKGGSQVLSDHLARFIESNGGEVLLDHAVNGFVVESGRITGVTYARARREVKESLIASAETIVLNAAPANIIDWLPEEYRDGLTREIAVQKPGASLLTIYFGFKSDLASLGSKNYSTFVFDDSVRSHGRYSHQ
jgi:all-trans-retinol 13,14-reductase